MTRIEDILEKVALQHPQADISSIQKAYIFSAKAHQGQTRLSGEPYLSHPLSVAMFLAEMRMDPDSVVVGLLHDTVEDAGVSLNEIEKIFGKQIRELVDGLTKISQITFKSHAERQAENMRKMILAMSADIRVLLIKLADRLHNMRTLGFQSEAKQKQIAQETIDIYAPLASRLGIDRIKKELEDLSFYYIDTKTYQNLKDKLKIKQIKGNKYIKRVRAIIGKLMDDNGIQAQVSGRYKNLYSIFTKMLKQNLDIEDVYDIIAFRIIVQSKNDCYKALGVIHATWKHIPGRFKDYINIPKANFYQSLHTMVIGHDKQRFEVQIRTEEMHRIAEEGIAAHWRYKEGKKPFNATEDKQFAWLRRMVDLQGDLNDPKEFLETLKIDLFPDEIYVFTPNGDVLSFPQGATPIDFAYAIHSEVGNHCSGAKVNKKLVPFKYLLKTGDMVEIITSPKQKPSKDWLKIARTSKARARIRRWIKNEEREQNILIGKNMLEKEFQQYSLFLNKMIKQGKLLKAAEALSLHSNDDLFAELGYKKITTKQVLGHLGIDTNIKEDLPDIITTPKKVMLKDKSRGFTVHGLEGLLTTFGQCCNPLPGDKVTGYITKGRGITIHKLNCPNLRTTDPGHLVEILWEDNNEKWHTVKVEIHTMDKKGVLAEISTILSSLDINIIEAHIKSLNDMTSKLNFLIEVRDTLHLQKAMKQLKNVQHLINIRRVMG